MNSESDLTKFVYAKQFECPICETKFSTIVPRFGKSRIASQDSDLKHNYTEFDPILYEVVICDECGYAETVDSFEKGVNEKFVKRLLEVIKPDFGKKEYPKELTTETALERYFIMSICNEIKSAKMGTRAYNYLKMAWICRNAEDMRETVYLRQARDNFKIALQSERPPIAGMDENAVSYLIGELERRLGNDDEALRWFSGVVVSNADMRVKDRARAQKDLILSNRKKSQEGTENGA